MKIEIDYTRSAQDNADQYFKLSKKLKKKAEGAAIAIRDLELKRKEIGSIQPKQAKIKKIAEKKWYEKFNWFTTSSKELVIGGKSAIQNEIINARHFESNDLFFHADVFGASAVILKGGISAPREIREEAAQFAVCFSKAWENGMAAANAYSLRRDQVSKSREKGSLGTGSFLLQGEREWFKGVSLELCAYAPREEGQPQICISPMSTGIALGIKRYILLKPGSIKKSDAAKAIATKLRFEDIDYVMQHLPPGSFSIRDI